MISYFLFIHSRIVKFLYSFITLFNMHNSKTNIQEFDKLVDEYNLWLKSLEDSKFQRKIFWKNVFKGFYSAVNLFNNSNIDKFGDYNPVYSRKDLSSKQKDIIALASDLQRVNATLDTIISTESSKYNISPNEAKTGKILIEQIYNNYKTSFLCNSER